MKTIIGILLLMCLISSNSQAQKYTSLKDIPYNQKAHSVKVHSDMLSASYWIMLSLTRKQAKKIERTIRSFYGSTHYTEITDLQLHCYLEDKLKGILTVNQYARFQSFKSYPELALAGGAPAYLK